MFFRRQNQQTYPLTICRIPAAQMREKEEAFWDTGGDVYQLTYLKLGSSAWVRAGRAWHLGLPVPSRMIRTWEVVNVNMVIKLADQ